MNRLKLIKVAMLLVRTHWMDRTEQLLIHRTLAIAVLRNTLGQMYIVSLMGSLMGSLVGSVVGCLLSSLVRSWVRSVLGCLVGSPMILKTAKVVQNVLIAICIEL